MSSTVTYRQQYSRCGKERCRKCKVGAGHGPFDYARAQHDYGDTLFRRSSPGECAYSRGLDLLREARNIFADCHAAIDLAWVDTRLSDLNPQHACT